MCAPMCVLAHVVCAGAVSALVFEEEGEVRASIGADAPQCNQLHSNTTNTKH